MALTKTKLTLNLVDLATAPLGDRPKRDPEAIALVGGLFQLSGPLGRTEFLGRMHALGLDVNAVDWSLPPAAAAWAALTGAPPPAVLLLQGFEPDLGEKDISQQFVDAVVSWDALRMYALAQPGGLLGVAGVEASIETVQRLAAFADGVKEAAKEGYDDLKTVMVFAGVGAAVWMLLKLRG